jgi:hypothetical protein
VGTMGSEVKKSCKAIRSKILQEEGRNWQ